LWDNTKDEAKYELDQLKKLIEFNSNLLNQFESTVPRNSDLMALGAILHSFYMGVENIFERIAKDIEVMSRTFCNLSVPITLAGIGNGAGWAREPRKIT